MTPPPVPARRSDRHGPRRRWPPIRGRALALLALAAACRPEAPPADAPAATSRPAVGTLRVALLHPGRETDRGWNQMAYDALMRLSQRPGISVRHSFTPNRSNFKADFRGYAEQGFDLVIGHGGEYVKAARQLAPDFPRTRFVVTGSGDAGDGVTTLDFQLWQATYLCGVLAAHVVPDGPAGVIGGEDTRPVRQTLEAFVNGARSVRPEYVAYTQYVGSWDDVAKAGQTARSLIEGYKVRVLFQNCDAAAFGVFQAARDAGVFVFGANSDQNDAAPAQMLGSAVIDMAAAFEQLVDELRAGTLTSRAIVHNLASGGVRFVPNPRLSAGWPPAALAAVARAEAQIRSGECDVLAAR